MAAGEVVGCRYLGAGARNFSATRASAVAPATITTTSHVPRRMRTAAHSMRKREPPQAAKRASTHERKKRLHGGGLKPCSLAEEETRFDETE